MIGSLWWRRGGWGFLEISALILQSKASMKSNSNVMPYTGDGEIIIAFDISRPRITGYRLEWNEMCVRPMFQPSRRPVSAIMLIMSHYGVAIRHSRTACIPSLQILLRETLKLSDLQLIGYRRGHTCYSINRHRAFVGHDHPSRPGPACRIWIWWRDSGKPCLFFFHFSCAPQSILQRHEIRIIIRFDASSGGEYRPDRSYHKWKMFL